MSFNRIRVVAQQIFCQCVRTKEKNGYTKKGTSAHCCNDESRAESIRLHQRAMRVRFFCRRRKQDVDSNRRRQRYNVAKRHCLAFATYFTSHLNSLFHRRGHEGVSSAKQKSLQVECERRHCCLSPHRLTRLTKSTKILSRTFCICFIVVTVQENPMGLRMQKQD